MLQRTLRSRLMLAGVIIALGAVAACHDATSISGPQVIQLSLDSIDGQVLPHEVSRSTDGTVNTVMTDMILSVAEDAKWYTLGHQTVTTSGVPQEQLVRGSGTWTVVDPNATFRDADGNIVYAGEVINGDFRVQDARGQVYYFAVKR